MNGYGVEVFLEGFGAEGREAAVERAAAPTGEVHEMSGRDDGAPSGNAVTEEVRPEPETVPRSECKSCLRQRISVRGYRLADGTTWEICVICATSLGAQPVAPECSEPSLVDICAKRVEVVEGGSHTTARSCRSAAAVMSASTWTVREPSAEETAAMAHLARDFFLAEVRAGSTLKADIALLIASPEMLEEHRRSLACFERLKSMLATMGFSPTSDAQKLIDASITATRAIIEKAEGRS